MYRYILKIEFISILSLFSCEYIFFTEFMNKWFMIIVISIGIVMYKNIEVLQEAYQNCFLTKVLFFTDVLLPEEYDTLVQECDVLKPYLTEENSSQAKRKTIVMDADSYANIIFYSDAFMKYLHSLLGFQVKPSSNLPIEFRMYETGGNMDWHRDAVHNDKPCPQIEMVFTLENTSDSKTLWKGDAIHEIVSQPNSIIITQGNGAFHKVTPVTRGYRTIIKVAYDIS